MHYGYGRYAHHHAFGILDLYDSAISEDPPPQGGLVWFGELAVGTMDCDGNLL